MEEEWIYCCTVGHEEFELFGYSIPDSVNNEEVRSSSVFVNFLNRGDRGRPSTSQIRCGAVPSTGSGTHISIRTNSGLEQSG